METRRSFVDGFLPSSPVKIPDSRRKNCILTFDLFVPAKHSTYGIGKKRNVFIFYSWKIPWWSPRSHARHTPSWKPPESGLVQCSKREEHKRGMMRRIESLMRGFYNVVRAARVNARVVHRDRELWRLRRSTRLDIDGTFVYTSNLFSIEMMGYRDCWRYTRKQLYPRGAQISRSSLICIW